MKRYFSFLFFLWIGHVLGQTPYQQGDFAGAGDSILVSNPSLFDILAEDFGPTGSNTNWDFTNLTPVSQEWVSYEDPNSTGFLPGYLFTCELSCFDTCYTSCMNTIGVQFICTGLCTGQCGLECLSRWNQRFQLAELVRDSLPLGIVSLQSIYNFYSLSGQSFAQTAIGGKLNGLPLMMEYNGSDHILDFPVDTGDHNTSASGFSFFVDSIPGVTSASFGFKRSQIRVNKVDGWGTLITPYGTFTDVLKQVSVISVKDTVYFQGDTLSLGDYLPNEIIPDTIIEYRWLSADFNHPLLNVVAWKIGGIVVNQSVQYIDSFRCFQPETFFGYLPIPAVIDTIGDSVEVNFYDLSFNSDLFLWNFDDPASHSNSSSQHNPSHYYATPGFYQVSQVACNTSCQPMVCDTFSLPLIVLGPDEPVDTTTAIFGLESQPFTANIRYDQYDNPHLEVFVATRLPVELEVFNAMGKLMMRTSPLWLPGGKSMMPIDADLPAGIYLLKLSCSSDSRVLKFRVLGD